MLLGAPKQVAYVDNQGNGNQGGNSQEGYQEGYQWNNQEYSSEEVPQGQEEANYVGNQGGYNYKPFNNSHPNLSYRSTNVENPQDQTYPNASNQGQSFQPRPYTNPTQQTRPPQQPYQAPKPNFVPNYNQSYQPRGNNFQQGYQQPRPSTYQQQGAPPSQPPQGVDLQVMFQSIMDGQARNQQETDRKIKEVQTQMQTNFQAQIDQVNSNMKSLEGQVAQLASSSQRTTGTLPGKAITNPKALCNVILASEEDEQSVRAIKLRSGKEIPSGEGKNVVETFDEENDAIGVEPTMEKIDDKVLEGTKESPSATRKVTYEPPPYEPKVPFPGRVKKQLLERQRMKFSDAIDKLEVSLPLLEVIKDDPIHAKFFKELISKSRRMMEGLRMEESKALEETSQPSSPSKPKTLVKQKHPGKFVIPCSIGGVQLDEALCDSGAFVNVISSTLVQEMGLKGMKPNSTALVFGDASRKTPKGVIEDCPILVGNCIVPTDLLVLDMVDAKKQPLILGAPFLTTVGAIIDYDKKVVVLKNVDAKVSYSIEPPTGLFGTITSGEANLELKVSTIVEDDPILAKDVLETKDELEYDPLLVKVASVQEVEEKLKKEAPKTNVAKVLKEKKLAKAKFKPLESNPPSFTLKPLEILDGKLECKVISKGHSKPFAKVKIILDPGSNENGLRIVSERMASVFGMKLNDRGPLLQDGSPSTNA